MTAEQWWVKCVCGEVFTGELTMWPALWDHVARRAEAEDLVHYAQDQDRPRWSGKEPPVKRRRVRGAPVKEQ